MRIRFGNNWHINTNKWFEQDTDFHFQLFSFEISWRYRWWVVILFNFEIRGNW